MADDPQTPTTNGNSGWMNDVQRAIGLILIGSIALTTMLATVSSVFFVSTPAVVDMAKTLQAAMVNMSLIALGFFFGSNMSKMIADAGQQKIVDKLTSTQPPGPTGPVAPVPAPIIVVSWWSLLTPAEQAAIAAAAPADARVLAILTALQSGKAVAQDVDDLVTRNLLTQDRANIIKAT